MEIEELKNKISEELDKVLPKNAFRFVKDSRGVLGTNMVSIGIAANEHEINGVRFQYPQFVSLTLFTDTMELEIGHIGGSGGNRIVRKPNPNDPRESYLAMKGVKIPFRRPKKTQESVIRAIGRFGTKWVEKLLENKSELMYQDLVDYDKLLN